jgi:hypothetical protein
VENLSRSSRSVLNRRTAVHFTGDALFSRIARAVCEAECLPRKELFEAWEVARRVRRQMRGGHVVEFAAGHGVLAALMLILDDTSPLALGVDPMAPPSREKVLAALVRHWPRLEGRIEARRARVEDVVVPHDPLLVSVHACGVLTDQVLDLAIAHRSRVAVLPCCHDLVRCDTGSLGGWLDGPLAVDVARVHRLQAAGFRVLATQIPAAITPQNRLIMAWPGSD